MDEFNFGERLKQAREDARLSQEQLAQRLGVTQQAVAAWEKGASSPRPRHKETLAKVLGKASGWFRDSHAPETSVDLGVTAEQEQQPFWKSFIPWASAFVVAGTGRVDPQLVEQIAFAVAGFALDLKDLKTFREGMRRLDDAKEAVARAESFLQAVQELGGSPEQLENYRSQLKQRKAEYAAAIHDVNKIVRMRAITTVPKELLDDLFPDPKKEMEESYEAWLATEAPPAPDHVPDVLPTLPLDGDESDVPGEPELVYAQVLSVEGDPDAALVHKIQVSLNFRGRRIVRWLTSLKGIPRSRILAGEVPTLVQRVENGVSVRLGGYVQAGLEDTETGAPWLPPEQEPPSPRRGRGRR